ncbi:PEGA domain-containing protein, partial [Methanoculleus sp.]
IYLYGRYTGEKTPYTFNGMSIGTYEVRAVSDDDSRTVEDVLVKPGETTRCVVALKEEYR